MPVQTTPQAKQSKPVVDLSFVVSIINGYITDLNHDLETALNVGDFEERSKIRHSVSTLENLKSILKQYVKDANDLGTKNES